MRFNAWKRNRFVSPEFTPELLREIDSTRCPVSGVEFTYGTGADTDWSVDRIDNDGGYAPGNVVIITVRVNAAKGSKSVKELLMHGYQVTNPAAQRVLLGFKESTELTKSEWQRLAWIAATGDKNGDYPVREVFDIDERPSRLCEPWCTHFQRIMIAATTDSAADRKWFWGTLQPLVRHPECQATLSKLRKSIEAYAKVTPVAERTAKGAFANDARFELFAEWWVWLAQTRMLKPMLRMVDDLKAGQVVSVEKFREDKSAATNGFA